MDKIKECCSIEYTLNLGLERVIFQIPSGAKTTFPYRVSNYCSPANHSMLTLTIRLHFHFLLLKVSI